MVRQTLAVTLEDEIGGKMHKTALVLGQLG